MDVSNTLVDLNARIINPPTLKYNPASRQPNVVRAACFFWMMKQVDVLGQGIGTGHWHMELVGCIIVRPNYLT